MPFECLLLLQIYNPYVLFLFSVSPDNLFNKLTYKFEILRRFIHFVLLKVSMFSKFACSIRNDFKRSVNWPVNALRSQFVV